MMIRFYMFDTILHDVSINCNDTDRCYWFTLIYRYYLVFLGHSCILMIQIGYTDSLSFIVTISSFDSIMIFDTVVQFCFIILYWYKSISSDSLFCTDTWYCPSGSMNSYVTIHYAVSLYNHDTIKFDDSLTRSGTLSVFWFICSICYDLVIWFFKIGWYRSFLLNHWYYMIQIDEDDSL